MYLTANFRPRIIANGMTHVKRTLEGKGKILVYKNDEVSPEDILARTIVNVGFSTINIAKKLGVEPGEAHKFMQRPLGSTIFQGELLAYRKSMFDKKVVLALTDGVMEHYDPKSGELRMRLFNKELHLTSGVYGVVEETDSKKGEIIIKTMTTQVFGCMGSGKERTGILTILSLSGGLFGASDIKAAMTKHIVVAGGLILDEAYKKAIGLNLNGLISGGINLSDFKSMSGAIGPDKGLGTEIGLSTLVTEGFGAIPIGEDIFNVIRNYEGRYVFLNGNANLLLLPSMSSDSILTLRKTVLPVRKTVISKPELSITELKKGQNARLICNPYMGFQGKIIDIDKTPTILESGILTYLVTIETKYKKIKVPFTNIEVIKA